MAVGLDEKTPLVVLYSSIKKFMMLLNKHGITYRYDEKGRTLRIKGQITHTGLYMCGFHFGYDESRYMMICRSGNGKPWIWIYNKDVGVDYIELSKGIEVIYSDGHLVLEY